MPLYLLTRTVLRDLCVTFMGTLTATTLFFVGILFIEINIDHGVGREAFLLLLPYVLPAAVSHSLSAAWLLAVCCVYGTLSTSNELLAVKAAGISPLRVIFPALVISAILVLPATWLIDFGNSWGRNGINGVVVESIAKMAYRRLSSDRSLVNKHISIWVEDVDGHELIEPAVCVSPDGQVRFTARAQSGGIEFDPDTKELTIRLSNGVATIRDRETLSFEDDFVIRLPAQQACKSEIGRAFALWQFPSAIAAQEARVRDLEQQVRRLRRGIDASAEDGDVEMEDASKRLEEEKFRLFRYRCFPHRRLSQGFCCLSFAVLGLPLSILLRNRDLASVFFLNFLPILLFFYPVEFRLARMSTLPPYSLWICHVVLIALGALLLRSVWKR